MRNYPRILVLPTQLGFFIKISRIGFPGNQFKIFISWESASLTVSETVFELKKISTGKKIASRNAAYLSGKDLVLFKSSHDSSLFYKMVHQFGKFCNYVRVHCVIGHHVISHPKVIIWITNIENDSFTTDWENHK